MRELLEAWNRDLLDEELIGESVDKKFLDARWLGNTPATLDDILANEERLGVRLPLSYRAFLRTANGWVYPGGDMNFPSTLRSIERVEWAAVKTDDGEWEAWHLNGHLPGAYRSRCFEELIRQQHSLLLRYRKERQG